MAKLTKTQRNNLNKLTTFNVIYLGASKVTLRRQYDTLVKRGLATSERISGGAVIYRAVKS